MITFESIRDLERAERESKKLQRLPETFVPELKDYLSKKSVGSPEEAIELQAVKSTVARLFEMRERKIVDGALIAARTGLPLDNLSASESEVFWAIVERLKRFREDLFGKLKPDAHDSVVVASQAATAQEAPLAWRVIKQTEFIGPDMREYKLRPGDVVDLPQDVVEVLAKNGVIERVKRG